MTRSPRIVALATLLCAAAWLSPIAPADAAGQLKVTFLAVGQGDAAIYEGPCGERGLVDAGQGSVDEVLAALDAAGSRRLHWVAPSHYDADHLGDVVDVATAPGVSVGAVYDRGGDRAAKDTATYRAYYDWATSAATARSPLDIGSRFSLCSGAEAVSFEVVSAGTDGTAAGGVAVSEENDRGVCLKVTYFEFDLATCGDVNGTDEGSRTDVESAVAAAFGDVEFARVNHHGSGFSSNARYVVVLSAQASVLSVGANAFGHPDPAVVARWRTTGELFQTQSSTGAPIDGNVVVTTAGTATFAVATSASARQRSFPMDGAVSSDTLGYWLVAADGGVFPFGAAAFYGSTGAQRLNQPVVCLSSTPTARGYYLVARDGGVFAFGDASFAGSTGDTRLNQPMVAMAAKPTGAGYWLVAGDGGIFAFGDARFLGSTGALRLNQPIVGMAATPSGNGYWLVAGDGGIFAFGDAPFLGSTGALRLNQPIVGMSATPSGAGYWLVAGDGGIFAFGDARFLGSTGALRLNQPIVGMSPTPSGAGYWLGARDGGIFSFGDARFLGSLGSMTLNQPVVGLAGVTRPGSCNSASLTSTTTVPAPTPTVPPPTSPAPTVARCDAAYPGVCIPPPPPDLDCPDIPHRNFAVLAPDPHGFDGNRNGVGCEA